MRRSELQALLNALMTDRNDLIDEVQRLHSEANTLVKGVQKDTSFTDAERDAQLTALRAERTRLRELHDETLTNVFLPAHKAARDAFYGNPSSSTEAAELYAKALKIFEDAYQAIHPDSAPTKKPAAKADDKAGKDDTTPKPVPAPKVDKDDDKVAKDDKTDPTKKPAAKADDKAGKDESPVDVAGLAALIKSGQDECRDGFTAVRAEIATVAKGTLPEDIAKVIREAGIDRVKALLDGTAPAAGLSDEDRALLDELHEMIDLLRLLFVETSDYTNEKLADMIHTLAGADKFTLGLFRPFGNRPTRD